MIAARTVRTRPRNGLAITDVLTSSLVSELCHPSRELWIATGWVTDIPVIDNRHHQFDDLLGSAARSSLLLSEVLLALAHRGCRVHVAVREVDHNTRFLQRLKSRGEINLVSTYTSPELHEKIIVGENWVMTGSMNFTWNGIGRNEEAIEFNVDHVAAATHRLELRTRWIKSATS